MLIIVDLNTLKVLYVSSSVWPVCILLSVPGIFCITHAAYFTSFFTCFQPWLLYPPIPEETDDYGYE